MYVAKTNAELIASLRPGDRVAIRVPAGLSICRGRAVQEYAVRKGRVVIASGTHAALNMGGRYGTPGVVTPENFVGITKRSSR